MKLTFCNVCDNIIFRNYTKEGIFHKCRQCGFEEKVKYPSDQPYLLHETNYKTKSKDIVFHEQMIHDPTLPMAPGMSCINTACNGTNIVYMKYDQANLRYLYVCRDCHTKWKNKE